MVSFTVLWTSSFWLNALVPQLQPSGEAKKSMCGRNCRPLHYSRSTALTVMTRPKSCIWLAYCFYFIVHERAFGWVLQTDEMLRWVLSSSSSTIFLMEISNEAISFLTWCTSIMIKVFSNGHCEASKDWSMTTHRTRRSIRLSGGSYLSGIRSLWDWSFRKQRTCITFSTCSVLVSFLVHQLLLLCINPDCSLLGEIF